MSWIYDAHIHLSDPEYKSDMDMILNYMDLLKIKACCVSMDLETSNETMNLYEKSKNVLPFIGIHPEMAQKESKPVYDLIEENNKVISGIGEIGLDRTYIDTEDEWNVQKEVFSKQLSLAEKFNKPVSIHSRKTLSDIFEILPSYKIPGILLHWFDGNKSQLRTAMIANKKIKSANYDIDTYKKIVYVYGISQNEEERAEVINEAKKVLDVEDVVTSIFLVEDLRVVKN